MNRLKKSLPLQILIAVVLGLILGSLFPNAELKPLSEIGKAVIHWVKLIAGPFLFLTIVASVVEVELKASDGLRLVGIALLNTAIAIALGMGLAKLLLADVRVEGLAANLAAVKPPELSIGFSSWMKTLMPPSLFAPFVQNEILLIALLALLVGLALRQVYASEGAVKFRAIAYWFEEVRAVPGVILGWLIHIIPLAVLTVVAGAVSEYGFGIFQSLIKYVVVVLMGFVLQVVFVYGTWLFLIARMKVGTFFNAAKEPLW